MTSKEQARQKQPSFLENMKGFEEVYEDELLAGTQVMSGRWKKTPTMWRSKVQCERFVIRDTKLLWQTTPKLFSTLKSVKANSCTHNHFKVGTRRF